jgi:hypothetical protein
VRIVKPVLEGGVKKSYTISFAFDAFVVDAKPVLRNSGKLTASIDYDH